MEQINEPPADRAKIRIGETVAAGMVEYDKERHYSLLSVLEEADRAMYERKQVLKESFFPDEKRTASDIPIESHRTEQEA